eukprot:COSAG06_NODE_16632_length_989_cov_2.749081_2_plen_134_part_00
MQIPSELQAAAAAASIQNTALGDPHDRAEAEATRARNTQQAQAATAGRGGGGGGAVSAPPGLGANAAAAGQLGPGLNVVSEWRVSDVAHWLRSTCGLAAHVPRFVEQGIDGPVLVRTHANYTDKRQDRRTLFL